MKKISDFHVHSMFSEDSKEIMENMVKAAIIKGLDRICFTEHVDFNPYDKGYKYFKPESYISEIIQMRKKYSNKIEVLSGMEFEAIHEYLDEYRYLMKNYKFDFVIGSIHLVDNIFIGSNEIRKKYEIDVIYEKYYTILSDMIKYAEFDVVGHLNFPVRYLGDSRVSEKSIEKILKLMIKNKKGIEINTSSIKKEGNEPFTDIEIIEKYISYGGSVVTIGSDAHIKENIGNGIRKYIKYQNY